MGSADIESSLATAVRTSSDIDKTSVGVGRTELHTALPPHASYEGAHRFDPAAEWTPEEERAIVRKTDIRLLSWLCLMVCLLMHDPASAAFPAVDQLH